MFIAALFTIARTWKQPKCPSSDEWIKKMWHIYTMEHYSAIKRNEIELFVVRWMELESASLDLNCFLLPLLFPRFFTSFLLLPKQSFLFSACLCRYTSLL